MGNSNSGGGGGGASQPEAASSPSGLEDPAPGGPTSRLIAPRTTLIPSLSSPKVSLKSIYMHFPSREDILFFNSTCIFPSVLRLSKPYT